MATGTFGLSNFQYPDGSPVANGTLAIRLSQDGVSSNTQIPSTFKTYPLNSSGNSGTIILPTNGTISPSGTYYIYEVYSSAGLLVSGPNLLTV